MQIDFNLLVAFQFIVVFQGFTTAWLLLRRSEGITAQCWLGVLVLALTLQSCNSLLISTGIYRDHHDLYFMPLFFSWSYGPLLFFYIKNSVLPQEVPLRKYGWHFVPVAIQAAFYTTVFFTDLATKAWIWENIHKPYTRFIDNYVAVAMVFAYVWSALPYMSQTDLRFRRFSWILLAFFAISAIEPMFNPLYLPPRFPRFYLLELLLPVLSYWLALAIYWREKSPEPTPLQRAAVNTVQVQQIVELMEKERLYLNPELTMPDVARHVGLNSGVVSQCINAGLGLSFNDFINAYRVQAFIQKIEKGEHHTHSLLGVALDSGFNSKNTFNRAFKKKTGMAPSEYIDKISP
jgi:AraC-like DNA-binding protein